MKRLFKNTYVRFAAAAVLIVILCHALKGWKFTPTSLSDAFAATALVFLVVGAWRFVQGQGTFATAKFGFLKLKELIRTQNYRGSESKLPSMGEFVQNYHYDKPVLPPMLSAAAAGILSVILWQLN